MTVYGSTAFFCLIKQKDIDFTKFLSIMSLYVSNPTIY